MYEGKRPGGLTALAVINFLTAGWNGLQMIGNGMMLVGGTNEKVGKFLLDNQKVDSAREATKVLLENPGLFLLLVVWNVALALTLLLSGIGYLKQKRLLGRAIGNLYALLSLSSIAYLMMSQARFEALGPAGNPATFTIGTLAAAIYPLLTLAMINTTFKEDFVR